MTRVSGSIAPEDNSGADLAAKKALRTARLILRLLFGPPAKRSFAVRLWSGAVEGPAAPEAARFTLILRRAGALRRMLLPPSELALAEAYLRDDIDVDGDLEAAAGCIDLLTARLRSPLTASRLLSLLLRLPSDDLRDDLPATAGGPSPAPLRSPLARHSRARGASAVRFHYDTGNDFYGLWLDRRMVYSCAYFQRGDEDIDAAQTAKLDYICRKLRLKPGERLLDIGCGWGGLVQYTAEHYGVQALGISLSEPQVRLARERIAAAGLGGRCRVDVCDYRDLASGAIFDKVVSVGMFEHVGRAQLPGYFAKAFSLTRPGGLFLNHGIVTLQPDSLGTRLVWRPGRFIQRYVFPGGELVRPSEAIRFAERSGFEMRDVESLREHYVLTLRHWVRRLEARRHEAVALVGSETYRVWRLYMSASARAFATGRLGIVQVLLGRPGPDGACSLPLTRADLYRKADDPQASEAILASQIQK